MVFIQSQEYIDSFGKPSRNIISLEGHTDYKISFNEETNKFDARIIVGDYEKYIFSCENEDSCIKILQNIFNHHFTKDAFAIYDVNAFMIPSVEEETTLEEIEDLIDSILKFHGYENVSDIWDIKREELNNIIESPLIIKNENNELSVNLMNPYNSNDIVVQASSEIYRTQSIEQKYRHYS